MKHPRQVHPPPLDGFSDLATELELLLSEKRTALSLLRTGIAVFALPLSVLSLLVATSSIYTWHEAAPYLLPLLILTAALIGLGAYLVARGFVSAHRCDRHLKELKNHSPVLATLME